MEKTLSGYGGVKVTFELESGGTFEATLAEMGLDAPDLKETVAQAAKYGYSGNAVSAYKTLKKAEKGKLRHTIPLKYAVSEKETGEILDTRSSELLAQPQNAYVTQQDGSVQVVKEKQGELPDHAKTIQALNNWLNEDWNGKNGTIRAAVKKTDPEITEKDLKGVTDLLGTYTTFYGSDGSGRAQNIETGASHIGGTLLAPGEELSANAAMEPYTYENGYAEAASYESNTVVQTMGGGICQVSTTLYNAILYAELEIVERYPHSMLVGYVEPSMDAAIADDVLDLVFKNNQKTPVYIESVLSGGNLTFNIYGKETRDPVFCQHPHRIFFIFPRSRLQDHIIPVHFPSELHFPHHPGHSPFLSGPLSSVKIAPDGTLPLFYFPASTLQQTHIPKSFLFFF